MHCNAQHNAVNNAKCNPLKDTEYLKTKSKYHVKTQGGFYCIVKNRPSWKDLARLADENAEVGSKSKQHQIGCWEISREILGNTAQIMMRNIIIGRWECRNQLLETELHQLASWERRGCVSRQKLQQWRMATNNWPKWKLTKEGN